VRNDLRLLKAHVLPALGTMRCRLSGGPTKVTLGGSSTLILRSEALWGN